MSTREDESTHTCERCGHAYTPSYGCWVLVVGGEHWVCFMCQEQHQTPRED